MAKTPTTWAEIRGELWRIWWRPVGFRDNAMMFGLAMAPVCLALVVVGLLAIVVHLTQSLACHAR